MGQTDYWSSQNTPGHFSVKSGLLCNPVVEEVNGSK